MTILGAALACALLGATLGVLFYIAARLGAKWEL